MKYEKKGRERTLPDFHSGVDGDIRIGVEKGSVIVSFSIIILTKSFGCFYDDGINIFIQEFQSQM